MPIDGIIYGLREAASRHPADKDLKTYVEDAAIALEHIDDALEKAYQDGKSAMKEEVIDMAKGGLL